MSRLAAAATADSSMSAIAAAITNDTSLFYDEAKIAAADLVEGLAGMRAAVRNTSSGSAAQRAAVHAVVCFQQEMGSIYGGEAVNLAVMACVREYR